MRHIINNSDYTSEVNSLMDFAQKRFGFSKVPKVLFDDDHGNAQKTLSKTGYYDPNTSDIHIYATGRHIKDILRSMAHELVHHMQNEKGELTQDGYMGPGYAQKNPRMREMERQAYEMGNLCFRDWEDSLKEKHPTIYNERRNRKMSLKNWKNKELNENLNTKWGFKMNLNEMAGYPEEKYVDEPMALDPEMMEPPMSQQEMAIEKCVEQKVAMGISSCDARPQCEQEVGMSGGAEMQPEMPRDVPFEESKKKSMKESLSRKIRVKIKK